MSKKDVLQIGHQALYQVSKPVKNIDSAETQTIIQNMWDTVLAHQGAGIAAPQIGEHLRIILFGVKTPRYQSSHTVPSTVLINPEVDILTHEEDALFEGCLSLKGLRGLVRRPTHIGYRGYDPEGRLIEREAHDFHARVVLHELDHLNGILFTQRIEDMKYFGFESELVPVN